jgi:ataxin-3
MLERMRREQEAALREHYHDEVSHFDPPPDRPYSGAGSRGEDEEEQLRRAIAESERMAREQGRTQTGNDDAGTTGARSANTQAQERRAHGGRVYDDEDAEFQAALQASLETAPPGVRTPDTTINAPPRAPAMRHSPLPAGSRSGPRSEPLNDPNEDADADDDDDLYSDGEDTATEETLSDTAGPPQAEGVNIEEMRRRRLARFGGP